MITRAELNPKGYTLTEEQEQWQQVLFVAINKVRSAYGKPMIVNSGVRSMQDQMRINPSAPKSKHLLGAAVDISDKDGQLWDWCMKNIKVLEEAGLYLEDKKATPTWVHFQCIPPKSGRRIFIP
jgi:hypothetical protein